MNDKLRAAASAGPLPEADRNLGYDPFQYAPPPRREITLRFALLRDDAVDPSPPAHAWDACWDLALPELEDVILVPGEERVVGLGFATAIPEGWCAHVAPRSSTQSYVAHGIIDAGYRGEWRVRLRNPDAGTKVFMAGDRIAQCYVLPVVVTHWVPVPTPGDLPPSDRGTGGFGSSGR